MCGITGYLDYRRGQNRPEMENTVRAMSYQIRHRGPDDSGEWVDPESGIALGFRRLAIIDLSETGRQPMQSSDGRYTIIYNGEVYNFGSIRKRLIRSGCSFRGTSDTEVMLAAICNWGIEQAVLQFNGMFAFALWDRQERTLTLVRDRLGIKPLYYGWMGDAFLFGSELKTLIAHPSFVPEIDRNALSLFLRHSYVPTPLSIYKGIRKLLPGSILTISGVDNKQDVIPKTYWSAKLAVEGGLTNSFKGSAEDAVVELDRLLTKSVSERMISDVPLGAFLSGGVDSSTIVSLMQTQSSLPVKTFTIGFYEDEFNEAQFARKVADRLGTDHTELYLTPEEAMAVIPKLPCMYDEPFSDVSQIPTYLVSKLARQHVTVSLSGDGGDELFAGYNRYHWGRRFWNGIGWIPHAVRATAVQMLSQVSPIQWSKIFSLASSIRSNENSQPETAEKIRKLLKAAPSSSPESMYWRLATHWENSTKIVRESSDLPLGLIGSKNLAGIPDFTQRMMYLDLVTYLPDDILAKVDRASMAVSLESRVPYLDDHRVVEYAWSLPLSYKIRNGQGKWVLRKVLDRYIPDVDIARPKMGFAVPIDNWLRGPLRDWAESLLDKNKLKEQGYLNPGPIIEKWAQHQEGKWNWQYDLWDILMFQSWLQEQGKTQ